MNEGDRQRTRWYHLSEQGWQSPNRRSVPACRAIHPVETQSTTGILLPTSRARQIDDDLVRKHHSAACKAVRCGVPLTHGPVVRAAQRRMRWCDAQSKAGSNKETRQSGDSTRRVLAKLRRRGSLLHCRASFTTIASSQKEGESTKEGRGAARRSTARVLPPQRVCVLPLFLFPVVRLPGAVAGDGSPVRDIGGTNLFGIQVYLQAQSIGSME